MGQHERNLVKWSYIGSIGLIVISIMLLTMCSIAISFSSGASITIGTLKIVGWVLLVLSVIGFGLGVGSVYWVYTEDDAFNQLLTTQYLSGGNVGTTASPSTSFGGSSVGVAPPFAPAPATNATKPASDKSWWQFWKSKKDTAPSPAPFAPMPSSSFSSSSALTPSQPHAPSIEMQSYNINTA